MNEETKKEIDGFKKVIDEIVALKTRKAADYGQTWRVFGSNGLFAELGRKFSRIWLNKDKASSELKNETLRDSLIDNATYSIMLIQMIDDGDTDDKLLNVLKGIK